MNTKKKLFVTIGAAVVITIGIAVACSDDITENNSKSITMKTGANVSHWPDAVVDFWDSCDNAYRRDSASLRTACLNNDYETFFSLTGITGEMMGDALAQAAEEMQKYVGEYPQSPVNGEGGCHCSVRGIDVLYETAKEIHRIYEERGITDPLLIKSGPGMSEELYACLQNCQALYGNYYHQDSLYLCQEICYILEKFREVTPTNPNLPEIPDPGFGN